MSEIFPVFVPSKGRADVRGTLRLLTESGITARMVVEPKEADAYRAAHPQHELLVLPLNDQGLVYSRNTVLSTCKQHGAGWFWMLDDDITGFFHTRERRNVRIGAGQALLGAQSVFAARGDVAQAALEYSQIAWSATKPFALNSYCDVAVCIHAERTAGRKIRYDEQLMLKEDRDFTLQVLASGQLTCRVSGYSFAAPKNGSNRGGLHDVYKAGRECLDSERMLAKWGPAICSLNTKSDGRPDVKVNWRFFQSWKKRS